MIAFDFIDEHFSKAQAPQCELSILIGMDSLCYLVSNYDRKVLLLRRYEYQSVVSDFSKLVGPVQEILASDRQLQLSYRQTRIGVLNQKSTLVPDRLFNERKKAAYLQNMFAAENNETVFASPIDGFHSVLVYSLPGELIKMVQHALPSSQIMHAASGQLNFLYRNNENVSGKQLFLNVRQNLLQLILMDGNKLLIYNTFEYKSSRDFVYYVLLIYDQFDLGTDEVPIQVSGYILENSEIFQLLYRYVKDVKKANPGKHFQLAGTLKSQAHMYMDLFCLSPVPVQS
ncbi:MAG: DUF3822 family protein [Saprospiraceae bacterium]|nr:DUF3822 family protein [Saprospiraceae bacterium]